jgi:probable phosphoglycerate mutase
VKRIIFLRHPQTAYNLEPIRLRGALDVPLSPAGFAQIPEIVEKLKGRYCCIKQVYSSPLERASILATTVAHEYGLKVEKLEGLKSRDYGIMNGKTVEEVRDVLGILSTGAGRDLFPKGGESMNSFLEKLIEAIKQIIYQAPEDGEVIISTHLQNIMLGTKWLFDGLPEISDFTFTYSEENEIQPGEWIEVKRDWVKVKSND